MLIRKGMFGPLLSRAFGMQSLLTRGAGPLANFMTTTATLFTTHRKIPAKRCPRGHLLEAMVLVLSSTDGERAMTVPVPNRSRGLYIAVVVAVLLGVIVGF